MPTVYALSAKGRHERDAGRPTLPAELRQVLHLVDGRRTDADLLAALADKSAVKAGGLRWLKASGFIVEAQTPDAHVFRAFSQPARLVPRATQPGTAAPSLSNRSDIAQAVTGIQVDSDSQAPSVLANFMAQSIRRWLGETGYPYLRQIECATNMPELLPHLNPLIDIIVKKAGADAGAEFADMAAFILNPDENDDDVMFSDLSGV